MSGEFRAVPSLDNCFEVNADGTALRSVRTGRFMRIKADAHHSSRPYMYAWVCLHGRTRRVSMAAAVAECWLGPRPPGLEVDHVDRDPCNNAHTNLRYVTRSEQMRNRDHTRITAVGRVNLRRHVERVSRPTGLVVNGRPRWFPSRSAAARFIAAEAGVKVDSALHLLRRRRPTVHGFPAVYEGVDAPDDGAGLQKEGF